MEDLVRGLLNFIGGMGICLGILVYVLVVWRVSYGSSDYRRKTPVRFTSGMERKVGIVRIKPGLNSKKVYQSLKFGSPLTIISLVIGYLAITSFIGEIRMSIDFAVLDFGGLLVKLILFLLTLFEGAFGVLILRSGLLKLVQWRSWIRKAGKARAIIIDREEEHTHASEMDYRYRVYTSRYALILKIADSLETTMLNGHYIRASVSERIYRKYARSRSLNIIYETDSPWVFLIHGE